MKLRLATILLLITCAFFLLIVAGCGKKDGQVVAKVGDREILATEVNDFFERRGARFPTIDDEFKTKREFLDSLIYQNLLVIGAYEHNLENHEEVQRVLDGEKHKFLLDVLFEQKIMSKATPSEAEMKDWYAKGEDEIKASHILVPTEVEANAVLQELKNGANFEELAVKQSIDPSAARNQGDLGWIGWGSMVESFQEAAYKMKPGEISAPVKTEYGYHIIKVADRRKVEGRQSYGESKAMLKQMIEERRKQTLMRDYYEELKKKFPITVEKPTCDFVLNKLEFLYPDTIAGTPRWRNNIDPAQLDQDEMNLVLGSYSGGQLTLGQYLGNLKRIRPESRPAFDQYDSLKEVVFQMSLMEILAVEAKNEGLEKSDRYTQRVTKFKEMAMADVFRNDTIPHEVNVADDEVRAYYDSHPDEFTAPLRFHLLEIQADDETTANKFKSSIRTEEQFRSTATAETQRPGGRQNGGDLGVVTGVQFPELCDVAMGVRVGQIAGPVKVPGGKYAIVWVKERIEKQTEEFEATRLRILDKLTKDMGDALYRQWIDDAKKRVQVEVFEDILRASFDKEAYAKTDTTQSGG